MERIIPQDIAITQVDINLLNPAPYNPRQASEEEYQHLKQSIETFGLVDPLLVNSAPGRENVIIGGHFRLKVAKDLGLKTVPVVYIKIEDIEKEKELNLRLNKNTGQWDFDTLANLDEEMLIGVGFSAFELDNIFDLNIGKTDKDETPDAPAVAQAKPGDIYQLGQHRLMCGDSTDPNQVKSLFTENGGGRMYADMLFTDPPYNVDYAGKGKDTSEGIKNDNLSEEEFGAFIDKAFQNMFEIMREGAVFYICSGWSSYPEFNKQLIASGFYRAGVIIWVKNNASYGWNDYRYKHEWILVGKRKAVRIKAVSILYGWKRGTHFFRDTRDEYDVWEVPREHSGDYKHPTQKPVWLVEKALANSSERGWIVADLFGGAGCTLIACERLKRRAFIMEYDPKYVDVIIKRWEEYTGEKAVCLHTENTNAGQD